MRTVQLYVNDERLDLFKDEEIQVSSSIQNVADISKVFTDFTQTFTVPASKRNNEILKYYYESALDNGFEANVRVDARIDIDYTPFRTGRLQLESAETKENQVYAYKVTFYGEVTTLKDLFGEDKLNDLDYSGVSFQYTGANVQTSITSTSDLDVRFPLISTDRVWTYSDGTGINDSTTYAIDYTELFPALKVSKVFEAIESTYGVTFSGLFLDDERFTKLFTWWKNQETGNFQYAEPRDLTFAVGTSDTDPYTLRDSVAYIKQLSNQEIETLSGGAVSAGSVGTTVTHTLRLYISAPATDDWYVDIYKNGGLNNTISGTGTDAFFAFSSVLNSDLSTTPDEWTFKIRTTTGGGVYNATGAIKHTVYINSVNYYLDQIDTLTTFTASSNIGFAFNAPDIKVADYFSGVLQMFNLTCYPIGNSTFQVEPLEAWYDRGRDLDITEFTDVKTITYERVKLHKKIDMRYAKCESFINENWKGLFGKEWGSLSNEFNYDGSELKIELPFENIQFTNLDEARFQVAYARETNPPDSKPYLPEPIMLYLYNEAQTCDFYFDNGTTTPQITSYVPFGQDVIYNGNVSSMNFGSEISSLLLEVVTASLYSQFYQSYLTNLFDPKNRKVYVTTRLPLGLLQDIELNDSLIIRDKKYTINEMKSNLTTGQVDFVLLQDLIIDRAATPPVRPVRPVKPNGGPVVIPVRPPKGKYLYMRADPSNTFTTPLFPLPRTYTPTKNIIGDDFNSFTVSPNTGGERVDTYYLDVYDTDQLTLLYTKTMSILQDSGLDNILSEASENLLTENLDTIVEE